MQDGNGFSEYKRLILETMERQENKLEKIDDKLNKISTEITLLKFKSGLWGLIMGSIPTLAAVAYILLKAK